MIYMVEMALIDTARRAEWDDWYLSHMKKLISIPGIQATQRFEALAPHDSPFVAMHQVTGPDVFTSDAYRAKAGGRNRVEVCAQTGPADLASLRSRAA